MNVFQLRDNLIKDYSSFVESFIHIRNPEIKERVQEELDNGLLWPEPLIQLSPSFSHGETVDELVASEVLHPECEKVFRINKTEGGDAGQPLRLHRHQAEAVKTATKGDNYVLTTGTGSGKSLAYIIPIVDHVLRSGSGKGIKAIVVYPMNALANSQEGELKKFLNFGYPNEKNPVTFRRYTGQESDAQKNEIRENPPDILLTNYVMLELILTRPEERPLVKAARDLRFLVLDELHTYRGRQGADVAMLVRRTKEATGTSEMLCVGTSATLASGGTWSDQQKEVAQAASLLFGSEVNSDNVIGETLQRTTKNFDFADASIAQQLASRISQSPFEVPSTFEGFCQDILASWIESTFGIVAEEINGCLVRQIPQRISGSDGAAAKLALLTGVDVSVCVNVIQQILMAGYECNNPETVFPLFAFRLHQFISRGDAVYASPESEASRYITVQKQQFVPGEDRKRILLPLVFCRCCGQEFYSVRRFQESESGEWLYQARNLNERLMDDDSEAGFLYGSTTSPWPLVEDQMAERVPDDWKDEKGNILSRRKKDLPHNVKVTPLGQEKPTGFAMAFLSAPFRFCPHCDVSYAFNQRSDFGKLSALGTEGRSSSTTILALAAIRHIRMMDLPEKARKLLSFTDNRQDASLQAGHFNDFIEVGLLRAALYGALQKSPDHSLRHDDLTQAIFETIGLQFGDYASNPDARFQGEKETNRALRNVLGYRLYRDLKRGWRITAPNLEQTGLLQFSYESLDDLCRAEDVWTTCHMALSGASPEIRQKICAILLDLMRRELAIKIDYLEPNYQERILQQSRQRLIPPWGFDEADQPRDLEHASVLYPHSKRSVDYGGNTFLSARSGFGQFLRRGLTFPDLNGKLGLKDTEAIIQNLLRALLQAGIVEEVPNGKDKDDPGYQLVAGAMIWKMGSGEAGNYDPIRQPTESKEGQIINEFFRDYYKTVAAVTQDLHAREHTAQVPYDQREEREDAFREGRLPILFCSPTMELGIDISQLNMVNMRNVPPTPANYAQRSGRAGRSGQPALVFTYCSAGSPHDQYFFKRPENMVAGAVTTPQIDLANEDLIRAHIHAIWQTEAGTKLGRTLKEVLDISGEIPALELLPTIRTSLDDFATRHRASKRAETMLATIKPHLQQSAWFTEDWLAEVMAQLPMRFEQACDRWKGLFKSALQQQQAQNKIILDASRTSQDRKQAQRLRREAEAQLDLLTTSQGAFQSDFYSYRYFASEGFLPGYNFPRLPLSAFIPGRRIRGGRDEYLSRPRFLAITEFAPRAFVYHEGSRYIIHQVILPTRDNEKDVVTGAAKICEHCGYLHPVSDDSNCDVCEHCGNDLGVPVTNLFRLQNVVAKRRDQINCDEEERLRYGFDLVTTVRFATRGGQLSCRRADVLVEGENVTRLSYGDAADIWRINRGYRKRGEEQPDGFVLDLERGYWASSKQEEKEDADPMSAKTIRVMPFINDSKNCLLFEPTERLKIEQIASLQAALKNAIQTCFELEDIELAVEPLPSRDDRRSILIYESAEGGAGVLKQLLISENFRRVIRTALELCHFDPKTGEDKHRGPMSREDCEAACYNCLMSYGNQTDHAILDRHSIVSFLLGLLQADIRTSSTANPRSEQLKRLMNNAGSSLEKQWLSLLEQGNYALPSHGQLLIKECGTRPDFAYKSKCAAVYIDGPPHDFPERQERDIQQATALEDMGWTVLRFHHTDNWQALIDANPGTFGEGK